MVGIGGARLAYEEFYRALGTTVDEVGLTTWRMVTTSVAGLLSIARSAWLAVFGAVAVARPIRDRTNRILVGTLTALVILVALLIAEGHLVHSVWLPANVGLGVLLVVIGLVRPDVVERRPQLRLSFRWFLGVAAASTVLLWAFAWANAQASARTIRIDGGRKEGITVLLDVDIRPVCVASTREAASWPLDVSATRPLLLLGTADGRVVLYDVRRSRMVSLPADETVMAYADRSQC